LLPWYTSTTTFNKASARFIISDISGLNIDTFFLAIEVKVSTSKPDHEGFNLSFVVLIGDDVKRKVR